MSDILSDLPAPVVTAITDLEASLSPSGLGFRLAGYRPGQISFDLVVLDEGACEDCVMPKDMLLEIMRFRLHEAEAGLEVDLNDPRAAD